MIRRMILAAIAAFGIQQTPGMAQKVTPVDRTESEGRVLLLDLSRETSPFAFNNTKGKITCDITADQTPGGGPAKRLQFKVIEPGVMKVNTFFAEGGDWRQKKFNEFSFWLKGDGSGAPVRITLLAADQKLFQCTYNLFSNDWQFVRAALPAPREGVVSAGQLSIMSFNVTQPCSFSVGEAALNTGGRATNLRERRTAIARRVATPPAMDGDLSDPAWANVPALESFVKMGASSEAAAQATEVRLVHDGQALYIAARLHYSDTSRIKNTFDKRDDSIYQEDDFEILFDVNRPHEEHYFCQLVASMRGVQFDLNRHYDVAAVQILQDSNWNGDWTVKTKTSPKWVDMEIRIPFADLRLDPAKAPVISMQLGRVNNVDNEFSSWSSTPKFPNSQFFGALILAGPETSAVDLSQVTLSEEKQGVYGLSGFVEIQGKVPEEIEVRADFLGPHRNLDTFTSRIKPSGVLTRFFISIQLKGVSEGVYLMNIVARAGKDFAAWQYTFDVVVPLNIKYGEVTFSPQPKELKWGKGIMPLKPDTAILVPEKATERTRKTAAYLQSQLQGLKGWQAPIRVWRSGEPVHNAILMSTFETTPANIVQLAGDVERLNSESYAIRVQDDAAWLVGRSEPGLYYAVVTLCQILRAPKVAESSHAEVKPGMLERLRRLLGAPGEAPQAFGIPVVNILDWPDLAWRVDDDLGASGFPRRKAADDFIADPKSKMDLLKRFIETQVAGNKLNFMPISLNGGFKWVKHPKLTLKPWLDAAELKELVDFGREHFVEIVPGVNPAGHDAPFMEAFFRAYPDLRMPDDKIMADISKPGYAAVVRDLLDELVDACHPRYVHVAHDEMWHKSTGKQLTHQDGVPRKEIFYNDLMNMYNHLAKKGVGMIMYSDMLDRNHNGHRFDCYTVAERLPKDIVIFNWHNSAKTLKDAGFKTVVDVKNGFSPMPQDRGIIAGYGIITYGDLMFTTQKAAEDSHGVNFCFHGLVRGADYAWNFAVDAQTPMDEWRRQKMLNLLPVYSWHPNSAAGTGFTPMDLSVAVNDTMADLQRGDGKGWFDLGSTNDLSGFNKSQKTVGLIPIRVTPNAAGADAIILRNKPEATAVVPVKARFASLVFLHTCWYPAETKEQRNAFRVRSRDTIIGIPVGRYVVRYTDGSSVTVPMLYGRNILEWTPYAPARFLPECRYTWETQLPSGKLGCLYQMEWVNPHPEKIIERIEVVRADTEADVAVVAITGRNVAE